MNLGFGEQDQYLSLDEVLEDHTDPIQGLIVRMIIYITSKSILRIRNNSSSLGQVLDAGSTVPWESPCFRFLCTPKLPFRRKTDALTHRREAIVFVTPTARLGRDCHGGE